MNGFEITFFEKYLTEDEELISVVHMHWIKVIDRLILTFWLAIFIPIIIYYYSDRINEFIPFYFMEWYLIFIFLKIVYDLFDWYNDVWIITNKWVINLDWTLFTVNTTNLWYENIEAVEVEQNNIIDKILNKWNIILHQFWEDEFVFEDAKIPYEAIEEIERLKTKMGEVIETKDDKFDLVMETLSEVVKNHLNENDFSNKKQENNKHMSEYLDQRIKQVEQKEWTIDLR